MPRELKIKLSQLIESSEISDDSILQKSPIDQLSSIFNRDFCKSILNAITKELLNYE